jgi:uncharacterized protein (DUF433 family)
MKANVSAENLLVRITTIQDVIGGQACMRGTMVTPATVVGLVASGASQQQILSGYPWLEADDISAALVYAAWRLQEQEYVIPA